MSNFQEITLARLQSYLCFALVVHYLNRALGARDEEANGNFDRDLRELEKDIDGSALFDELTPHIAPTKTLQEWFPRATDGRDRFVSVWKDWFTGRSAEKGRDRKGTQKRAGAVPLPPTLHQIQPFTGNPSPHNMIDRFERFLWEPDEERRAGRESEGHPENLAAWGHYARDLVAANGGWAAFSRRARNGGLIDFWPGIAAPRTPVPVTDSGSLARRIRALAENKYLQIVVPSVAMAWPLWMLKMLWEHQGVADELANPFVQQLRAARQLGGEHDHLIELTRCGSVDGGILVEFNQRPGRLAGLPFPFGAVDKALAKVLAEKEENDGKREKKDKEKKEKEEKDFLVWELEWFTPLLKKLFESDEAKYWCPPILLCHRADIDHGADAARYLVASDPCQSFGSVFSSGGPGTEHAVAALKGSWGEYACGEMEAVPHRILPRTEYFLWTASPVDRAKAGLFLGSFPFDVFLREAAVPLSRRGLYSSTVVPPEALEKMDYVMPGMGFFSGRALAGQARMLPLLTEFGGLLKACRDLVRGCSAGISHERVQEVARTPVDLRSGKVAELSGELVNAAFRILPPEKNRGNLLRSLLVQLGQDMGANICPPELRDRYNTLITEWAWVHLFELTYYSNVSYGHELVAKEN